MAKRESKAQAERRVEAERLRSGKFVVDFPDTEPTFELRAHDILAPEIIEAWASRLASIGGDAKKIASARAVAHKMRAWQSERGARIPGTQK